jgi:hypothetical protein
MKANQKIYKTINKRNSKRNNNKVSLTFYQYNQTFNLTKNQSNYKTTKINNN